MQLLHSDPSRTACATDLQLAFDHERALGPWIPLVRAQDLLDLGCGQGPVIGRLLHGLEDAQLEGRVSTREEALALAARLLTEDAGRVLRRP